jgi:hypothetical protein
MALDEAAAQAREWEILTLAHLEHEAKHNKEASRKRSSRPRARYCPRPDSARRSTEELEDILGLSRPLTPATSTFISSSSSSSSSARHWRLMRMFVMATAGMLKATGPPHPPALGNRRRRKPSAAHQKRALAKKTKINNNKTKIKAVGKRKKTRQPPLLLSQRRPRSAVTELVSPRGQYHSLDRRLPQRNWRLLRHAVAAVEEIRRPMCRRNAPASPKSSTSSSLSVSVLSGWVGAAVAAQKGVNQGIAGTTKVVLNRWRLKNKDGSIRKLSQQRKESHLIWLKGLDASVAPPTQDLPYKPFSFQIPSTLKQCQLLYEQCKNDPWSCAGACFAILLAWAEKRLPRRETWKALASVTDRNQLQSTRHDTLYSYDKRELCERDRLRLTSLLEDCPYALRAYESYLPATVILKSHIHSD